MDLLETLRESSMEYFQKHICFYRWSGNFNIASNINFYAKMPKFIRACLPFATFWVIFSHDLLIWFEVLWSLNSTVICLHQGIHLDPSIYLVDEENIARDDTHTKKGESETSGALGASGVGPSTQGEQNLENTSKGEGSQSTGTSDANVKFCPEGRGVTNEASAYKALEDANSSDYIDLSGHVSETQGCLMHVFFLTSVL